MEVAGLTLAQIAPGTVAGIVIAFGVGMIAGWAMRSRASSTADPSVEGAAPVTADDAQTETPDSEDAAVFSETISALEAEVKKARDMLDEDAEENAGFAELIGNLDDAVKRANGRLKVITKSVQRGATSDDD